MRLIQNMKNMKEMVRQLLSEITNPHTAWIDRSDEDNEIEESADSLNAKLTTTEGIIDELDSQLGDAMRLLLKLVDNGQCDYSTGGVCQTHGYEAPCPHLSAKNLISERKAL